MQYIDAHIQSIDEVNDEINKINNYIKDFLWLDFEFAMINAGKVVMAGAIDQSYGKYCIDIEFEQPYCNVYIISLVARYICAVH